MVSETIQSPKHSQDNTGKWLEHAHQGKDSLAQKEGESKAYTQEGKGRKRDTGVGDYKGGKLDRMLKINTNTVKAGHNERIKSTESNRG